MTEFKLKHIKKNLKSLRNDNIFNIPQTKKENIKKNIFKSINKKESAIQKTIIPALKKIKTSI